MNYTLQKVNCKVLFGVAISLAAAFVFSVQAYAYEMVLIPNFVLDNNYVYVAKGVSPRTASLSSVSISYDSLADLVYYCNEHGLSTSLVYNSAVDAYVGWVNDSAINITGFSYTTLNGLLGNNAGKVYVAQDSNSAGTGDINSPSHWMSFPSISPVISPVSYDALCRIVLDLNAVQQPAEITTYSYGNTTYYVVISDGGRSAGKYYCSLDGRIYAIPADKADISLTIQVWCYQIKNKLVGLSDYIQNTLDSKLDTLTSVISNGKVLVDNSDVVSALYTDFASVMGILKSVDTGSLDPTAKFPALTALIALSTETYKLVQRIGFGIDDVVSAIQSIPAFDDTDIITAIQSIPAYDDSALVSAVTTISNQITEQFGEYESTYSFPNFSSSGQSVVNNKIVSGVLPSAFTSINPGTRKLLYSPSGTLTLLKSSLYAGGGTCSHVTGSPYFDSTYGVGYCLQFEFRFSSSQSTNRYETVQFPQVSFTDYSGKSLTLSAHSGSVLVRPYSRYAYGYRYFFPRWDASGNWLGWSGQNDTFQFSSSSYEPSKRVYLTPPESGTYYIYCNSDTAIPVVYASRFTGFLQSQTDRVVNAVGSIPAPTDYTSQLTAVVEKLDALANKPAVDLTTIESTLSTISDKLDNTASDVNNTIINITNDNDYFSVFYITDGDGNTQSVTDFAGALTGASGKLLSLLYRLVFADALGSVDGDLGNMEDFFTSEEPPPATAAMNGDTAPANEVIDVWAS